MHHLQFKASLRGVLAFSPTPFTAEDELDLHALAEHVDFLCRSGVPVVVVCGGVGEFFSLEMEEYRACIRTAVEAVGGRCIVAAGIGHSTRIARKLATFAEDVGVDGLMINPPYFIQPSEEGLLAHYRGIADATSLGMIVFSTPGSVYTASALERLAEVESVVALKDEHGDLKLFGEMVERLGDRYTWINGMAEILAGPYATAGAQAMTSGLVNFAPALSLEIWRCAQAGEWTRLRQLVAEQARPIARLRERKKGYQIAIIKEAMNLLDRRGGHVRPPVTPVATADRQELREVLKKLTLAAPAEAAAVTA